MDSQTPYGVLLSFSTTLDDKTTLDRQIKAYPKLIYDDLLRTETQQSLECHLLMVGSCIPSHCQVTNDMQDFLFEKEQQERESLNYIAGRLGIPKRRCYLAHGNKNLQTLKLAKQLNVKTVYGYSRSFRTILELGKGFRSLRAKARPMKERHDI